MAQELLVSCRFCFDAPGIGEKDILEVSGLTAECPPAGKDKVCGSGKGAKALRQTAPTQVNFGAVTVKIIASKDKSLYEWFEKCNKNAGGKSDWASNKKEVSIIVYTQDNSIAAKWSLLDAYPFKYEGPNLDASSNDVANETITLIHDGLKRDQ